MLWIKRAAALLFSSVLIVSCGSPALAVTPQEGWFISGITTVDGIDYYIIDNKLSSSDWWLRLSGGAAEVSSVVFPDQSETQDLGVLFWEEEAYHGYSPFGDWRVDNDWLLEIKVLDFEVEGSNAPFGEDWMLVYAYDRTRVPLVTVSSDEAGVSIGSKVLVGQYSQLGSIAFYSDQIESGPVTKIVPFSSFLSTWGPYNDYTVTSASFFHTSGVDGTNINDLVIAVAPGAADQSIVLDSYIALRFYCPVDKAPSGMAVGDEWPKSRPLEVELADAYDAYKQTMLNNGQIKDPSDINTMFGQLGGMQEQGLGALEIGDAEAGFFTAAVSMMQPLFLTLLPIIGVGVILIIFANKGMHG